MKFPDHLELIVPTIKALKEMGGTATPAEITNKVIELEKYPEEIQTEPQKGDGYRTKLEYRLAWARTYMKKFLNAVEDKSRGLWSLTADGLKLDISDPKKIIELALENKKKDLKVWQKNSKKEDINNEETIEDDSEDWKNELLEIINTSSPKSFENLSQRVLRESGCIDVKVSGGANDKGIDGSAVLRLGLISFPIKFQCKRYGSSVVTPSQVREFRGSLGQIDKGIFITTSRFTKLAIEEGQDPTKGKTIDLIDGDRLCELLREYKIGINEKNDVNIDKDFFENI
jgi:restriction system protein